LSSFGFPLLPPAVTESRPLAVDYLSPATPRISATTDVPDTEVHADDVDIIV